MAYSEKLAERIRKSFGHRDDVVEKKLDMLHCHTSQMYEWLPWIAGNLDDVPEGNADRRKGLEHRLERFIGVADAHREKLIELYGEEHGSQVKHAEGFEACEYGGSLDTATIKRLFPFI